MSSVEHLSDAMVHVTLEDRAVDADAKRESKQAFLDAYLIWLRGGESGMAYLTSQFQEWHGRMVAASAAGRLTRRVSPILGEWAAEVQAHLVACERWATTARADDFVLADELAKIQRWGLGIGVMVRNLSFQAAFPDIGDAERKPLNRVQQGIIIWAGMVSGCLEELFDIIATHRAVV